MKIVTLMENTTCREDLCCEHGLSLYLESGKYKILFDAGQSCAFAEHAEKLGISLDQVDFCVLSHGHYDHSGGLGKFLEINKTAPVYVSHWAFEPHWESNGRYVGVDQSLQANSRIRLRTSSMPAMISSADLPSSRSLAACWTTSRCPPVAVKLSATWQSS